MSCAVGIASFPAAGQIELVEVKGHAPVDKAFVKTLTEVVLQAFVV
jgi:hypothetical protein